MTNTTSQYFITEAVISSALSPPIDISSVIVGIDLFENIKLPYITGRVAISDDNDIFTGNTFTFRGTETLRLQIDIPLIGGGRYIITKEFIMNRISSMAKANDRAGLVIVDIIEPHGYLDELKTFSKSYTGTPVDIISKILTDGNLLNLQGKFYDYGSPPVQEPIKFTVPYKTPLQAVEMMRARCTTKNGSPYFLYTTVHGDGIEFNDLDTILRHRSFNSDAPFVESNAFLSSDVTWTTPEFRIIGRKSTRESHNALMAIQNGSIASNITHTDISTNKSVSVDYSVRDTFNALYSDNILPTTSYQNVYNHGARFNNENMDEMKSKYFHQIGLKTYADHNNYFDDDSRSKIKSRIQNISDRALLEMNKVAIEMPGYSFLGGYDDSTFAGVGNMVSLIFSGNNSSTDQFDQRDQVIDTDRSGNYLMTALRHTFSAGKIVTSLDGCKLTENYRELS